MELVVVDNHILEKQQHRVVVDEGRVEVVVVELGIARVGEGEGIALLNMWVPAVNAVPVIRVLSLN